jgi:hypothetical protein
MKTLIAVLLICGGVWLFHTGWLRRDSIKGITQSALASAARRFDGETRVPEHTWYMIAGGLSVLAGIGVLYSGRKG